ncbi:MAG: PTS sugar transporter subunit IIB [Elusimicrobia bacterium]|nr:PTS sugar transporter subunit IIB [Elusimicrobiota bacterium]
MEIALLRIDDRLIHGQVVIGWIPHLGVEAVVVASDAAAADETQSALMGMAMPEGVELLVRGVAQAAAALRRPDDRRRVLVLVPGPLEARRLVESGVAVGSINVGGLHYTAGRVQLGKAIFLSAQDTEALRALSGRGIALEGRALPEDAAIDLLEMLGGAS